MAKHFLITLLLCTMLGMAQQLPQKITGQLIFESGATAVVNVSSQKNGNVVSLANGSFSILIRFWPDTLIFSAVGYQTVHFPITAKTTHISLSMKLAVNELEAVTVSTGYQQKKANEMLGNIANIGTEQLNARQGANILERILGQSTGIMLNVGKSNNNPQSSTGISIRGLSSINGPLDPLIVLDGYIYEGDLDNINPNDVASIDILKDAAAAAIWGARAGNGVIVMTSKSGKYNQALRLNVQASTLVQQKPNLMSVQQITPANYVQLEQYLFGQGYYNSQLSSRPYLMISPVVSILQAQRNGSLNAGQVDERLAIFRETDSRKSYLDEFYTNAVTQQYNFTADGGSQKHKYVLGFNYQQQQSDNYGRSQKLNLNLGNDFRLTEKLSLNTKLYLTATAQTSGRPSYNSIAIGARQLPYLAFKDADGQVISYDLYDRAYVGQLAGGKLLSWAFAPAEDYQYRENKQNKTEAYVTAGLNYQLCNWLQLNLGTQYSQQLTAQKNHYGQQSYYVRNLINSYTQYNVTKGTLGYPVPLGDIMYQDNATVQSYTHRLQANINKDIGKTKLRGIMGFEMREHMQKGNAYSYYGYHDDPIQSVAVDNVGYYANILTGDTEQVPYVGGLSARTYRFVSQYANISYSYLDRYSVAASIRRDGSNIFGLSTNDKWKPLWSIGAGWQINREKFYSLTWLPELKLRASYGKSGNVDLSRTALPVLSYATNSATGYALARVNSLNNPSLKWETSAQLNLSLDFVAKNRLLYGSISFFRKRGSDLYGAAVYDYTAWGRSNVITKNVADMEGKGVELELNAELGRSREGLWWKGTLLANYNVNKTLKYFDHYNSGLFNILSGGKKITPLEGKPLYALAAYRWAGLDANGNPQGYLNGQLSTDYANLSIDAAALEYVGSASPEHYGNIISNFNWKKLTLAFNISYRLGYYTFKPALSYSRLASTGLGGAGYAQRWQKPGDEAFTDVPSLVYPLSQNRDGFFTASAINVINAGNIRLDYVNLFYRLSPKIKSKQLVQDMQLRLGLQNGMLLWTANKDGIDPDYTTAVSPSKLLTLGVNLTF